MTEVITFNAAVLALPTDRVEIGLQLNDDEAGRDKSGCIQNSWLRLDIKQKVDTASDTLEIRKTKSRSGNVKHQGKIIVICEGYGCNRVLHVRKDKMELQCKERERERERERGGSSSSSINSSSSNLVCYAQSTIAVISGQNIFCYHTIIVKNVNTRKLVYVQF